MSTHAQIAYIDGGNNISTLYVHADGYPSELGEALTNHYQDFYDAVDLVDGDYSYISGIDKETGEVYLTNNQKGKGSVSLRGSNIDHLLEKWWEECNYGGASYAYLFSENGWEGIKMSGQRYDFIEHFKNKLNMNTEKTEIEEGDYRSKWKNFLKEGEDNSMWAAYVKSLVNDIKINGIDEYTNYSEDDIMEDFNFFLQDKMSS